MGHSHKDDAHGGHSKSSQMSPMAHSVQGSTKNIDETLKTGGKKESFAPAHVGHTSTSHECEALGGMQKKMQKASQND